MAGNAKRRIIEPSSPERYTFIYRCPACCYVVDRETLFGIGCPVCGWESPLVKSERMFAAPSHIDIIEEEGSIRVTMQMSLPEYEDLRLELKDGSLMIASGKVERLVPVRAGADSLIERSYRNGVLDVRLRTAGKGDLDGR